MQSTNLNKRERTLRMILCFNLMFSKPLDDDKTFMMTKRLFYASLDENEFLIYNA